MENQLQIVNFEQAKRLKELGQGNVFPLKVKDSKGTTIHYGINLREYYAGLVMQGILNDPQPISNSLSDCIRLTAEYAVKYADALLEELTKPEQP